MENKKITINNSDLANLVVGNVSNSTKLGSGGITLDPMMAKIFIGGMLKSKGINQKEINDTLNILDSKVKQTKTTPFNDKKETNNEIQLDSSNKKETNDIPVKNDLDDSLESTKLV